MFFPANLLAIVLRKSKLKPGEKTTTIQSTSANTKLNKQPQNQRQTNRQTQKTTT